MSSMEKSKSFFVVVVAVTICFVLQFSESFQSSTSESYLSGKCVLSIELAVNSATLLYLLNYQILLYFTIISYLLEVDHAELQFIMKNSLSKEDNIGDLSL